jgi:hypothetical protein
MGNEDRFAMRRTTVEAQQVKEVARQYQISQTDVYKLAFNTYWEQRTVETVEKARLEKERLTEERELMLNHQKLMHETDLEWVNRKNQAQLQHINDHFQSKIKKYDDIISMQEADAEVLIKDAPAIEAPLGEELFERFDRWISKEGISYDPAGKPMPPEALLNTLLNAFSGRVTRIQLIKLFQDTAATRV